MFSGSESGLQVTIKDAKIRPKGILAGGTVVRASMAGVHINTKVY